MSTANETSRIRILTGSRLITSTRVGGEIWDRVKHNYGDVPDDGRQRLAERTPGMGPMDWAGLPPTASVADQGHNQPELLVPSGEEVAQPVLA